MGRAGLLRRLPEKKAVRRRVRPALLIPAACTLFFLSGCGEKELERPYSFAEQEASFSEPAGAGSLPLFAQDLCVITQGDGPEDASVTAQAGGLFNVTDAGVIYSKNAFERMYPASITKVMTAILAIEEGDPDEMITVGQEAVIDEAGASLCGIKPGDQLTLRQLLYGLMIPSGNDAANTIAVHLYGSIDAFAERMNERARELGATATHFVNPNGLNDENHYTTAYDLYLIFNEALKLPEFREIIGTSSFTASYTGADGESCQQTWTVGNWYQKGEEPAPEGVTVLGGKTGTTQAAGYCLIMASSDAAGKEYISVVLKADSRPDLYDNMTNIITKIVN